MTKFNSLHSFQADAFKQILDRSVQGHERDLEIKLLQELENLRIKFMKLDEKMQQDHLKKELELYVAGKIVRPSYVLQAEMDHLIELNKKYEEIRERLIKNKSLSSDDICEIEQQCLAVQTKKGDLKALQYFPNFQKLYEGKLEEERKYLSAENNKLMLEQSDINKSYHHRHKEAGGWYAGLAVLSVIGVGIPFLMGTLIWHLADKIRTSLKVKARAEKINANSAILESKKSSNTDQLEEAIKGNTKATRAQFFFFTKKSQSENHSLQLALDKQEQKQVTAANQDGSNVIQYPKLNKAI